jgi:transcriptional regulator GlxA family with amidase domain
MDYRIEIAINLIKRDVCRAPRTHQLASKTGLSVSHFHCLFRKDTGTVPGAYIRRLRFEMARNLVSDSSFSIKEITHLVGIHDVSHFVRDFEKMFGLSPRTLRRVLAASRERIHIAESDRAIAPRWRSNQCKPLSDA